MPTADFPDVPKHVQKVRDMTTEELEREAEAIYSKKAVEPVREIPNSFRDDGEE